MTQFFAMLLFAATSVSAATYDLKSSTGLLGTSQTYEAQDAPTVTAYGFDCFSVCAMNTPYSATNLWGDSVSGLGVNGGQITPTSFVMFDWGVFDTSLSTTMARFLPFTQDENQRHGVHTYYSNSLGALELKRQSTDVLQDSVFLSHPIDYQYIAFTGWNGVSPTPASFTLTSVVSGIPVPLSLLNPIPEPETYAMLLAGLGLLGFVRRRATRRRR